MSDFDSKKGLNVSSLKAGTVVSVETKRSVYSIEIVEGSSILIVGGMKKNGEFRFSSPTPAEFKGSSWSGGEHKISDWIGKDMHLELIFDSKGKKFVFTSSPVIEVEITAPDKSWSYSMDWKNE